MRDKWRRKRDEILKLLREVPRYIYVSFWSLEWHLFIYIYICLFLVFGTTVTHTHIYIYIYIYICLFLVFGTTPVTYIYIYTYILYIMSLFGLWNNCFCFKDQKVTDIWFLFIHFTSKKSSEKVCFKWDLYII